jgi:hypothetical protein
VVIGDQASLTFSARGPFGPCPFFEAHRLPFAQVIKGGLTRGLVKEVFTSVAGCNEAEPFVVHQPLDRAVRRSHVVSSFIGR